MAFKFDEDHMGGTGTLAEYFGKEAREAIHIEGLEGEDLANELKILQELAEERDDAVDRLCLQLFTEYSGVSPDEPIRVIWPSTESDYGLVETDEDEEKAEAFARNALNEAKNQPGLTLVGHQPDDPTLMLFRDGQPISAFYASYRGVYQAGGYVHADARYVYAHNAFNEKEAGPMNVWQDSTGGGICDIPRNYLLTGSLFDDEDEIEEED